MAWLIDNWKMVGASFVSLGLIIGIVVVFIFNYKVGGFARGTKK